MHTQFWLENQKRRDPLEDLEINGNISLECILGKYVWRVLTGFIWLRIGTIGGFLWTR